MTTPIWPAIELLHNPQEKLLAYVRSSNEHFGIRLLICNFISRLIGSHKLILLGFYSYIQRYLTSHQEHVTQILSYSGTVWKAPSCCKGLSKRY